MKKVLDEAVNGVGENRLRVARKPKRSFPIDLCKQLQAASHLDEKGASGASYSGHEASHIEDNEASLHKDDTASLE